MVGSFCYGCLGASISVGQAALSSMEGEGELWPLQVLLAWRVLGKSRLCTQEQGAYMQGPDLLPWGLWGV